MRKEKNPSSSAGVSSSTESSGYSSGSNGQVNGAFVDHVRQRAYELYEHRLNNNADGDPTSDWLTAEEQVRLEFSRGNDILA